MKKTIPFAFIFVLSLFLIFLSCSKSDNEQTNNSEPKVSSVSAKINGTLKNYNTISITPYPTEGYHITASVNGSASDLIEMDIFNNTGTGTLITTNFLLKNNSINYEPNVAAGFGTNVTTNNSTLVQGSFSGQMWHQNSTPPLYISISKGTFKVYK
jgi:hypothetical protein